MRLVEIWYGKVIGMLRDLVELGSISSDPCKSVEVPIGVPSSATIRVTSDTSTTYFIARRSELRPGERFVVLVIEPVCEDGRVTRLEYRFRVYEVGQGYRPKLIKEIESKRSWGPDEFGYENVIYES